MAALQLADFSWVYLRDRKRQRGKSPVKCVSREERMDGFTAESRFLLTQAIKQT
jgi:hypothetical protein